MLFSDLSLIEPLLKALEAEGYTQPTPIQEQAIPVVLQGRDLLGCAQTGTGKTAAFSLPILQLLKSNKPKGQGKPIRTLILTPTRELAIQIGESIAAYGRNTGISHSVIFGGVGQEPQVQALKRGIDILVATPGRLLDLMQQGYVHLSNLEIFVLDEADRMLDMGFIHDVKKVIAKLPQKRQTLFFSATMPDEIAKLADSILFEPIRVEVTPVSSTAEKVGQSIYFTDKKDKKNLLIYLLKDEDVKSALVFTRTKHGANRVAGDLTKAGIRAEAIHGNKSQTARQNALQNFKNGKIRVLVATDIAARGIDIEELSHVINFELPNIPETYVHRIGRTGRAGASGLAMSLCDAEELPFLKDIQKLISMQVPVVEDHPYAVSLSVPVPQQPGQKKAKQQAPPPPPRKPEPREGVIPLPDRRPDQHGGQSQKERRPDGQQPREQRQGERRQEGDRQQRPQNGQQQPREQRQGERRQEGDNQQHPQNGQQQPREQRQGERRQEGGNQRPQNGQQQPREQRNAQGGGQQQGQRRDGKPKQRQEERLGAGGRSGSAFGERRSTTPAPRHHAPPKSREALPEQSVASQIKNRFSSILEVSSIEKQDYRPKPKPRQDKEERWGKKKK
jgi:ATP-dependent RNA helicase RhlE